MFKMLVHLPVSLWLVEPSTQPWHQHSDWLMLKFLSPLILPVCFVITPSCSGWLILWSLLALTLPVAAFTFTLVTGLPLHHKVLLDVPSTIMSQGHCQGYDWVTIGHTFHRGILLVMLIVWELYAKVRIGETIHTDILHLVQSSAVLVLFQELCCNAICWQWPVTNSNSSFSIFLVS